MMEFLRALRPFVFNQLHGIAKEERNPMYGENTSPELEQLATIVVDCIFKVHKKFGPGLLESVYEHCLAYELSSRGLDAKRQVDLPINYEGVKLDAGYRIDLLVNNLIIIELKAVEKMNPLFKSQLMTYLKLSGLRLGFLVNFNVELIKDGIQRVVF